MTTNTVNIIENNTTVEISQNNVVQIVEQLIEIIEVGVQGPPGAGVTDHGLLTGLADDDHSQYYNSARIESWIAAKTVPFQQSVFIRMGENADFYIIRDSAREITITSITSICESGSANATFKINSTNLGGGANNISTSEQTKTHSSNNVINVGDDFKVTLSSNSSMVRGILTIKGTVKVV